MATTDSTPYRKNHPVVTYLSIIIIAIAFLLTAVRLAITPVLKFSVIHWLGDHGVTASIENIELNIARGQFALIGLNTHDASGNGGHIGTLKLGWQWNPLAEHRLVVNQVQLDDVHVNTLFYADGKMNIAGLKLPLAPDSTAAAQPKKNKTAKPAPFAISLTSIKLGNISACATQLDSSNKAAIDYCASLGALNWKGDIRYTLNPKTSHKDLPLAINGMLTLDNIQALNNKLHRNLLSINTVKLDGIKLKGLNQISLKQISIDQLDALERSDQAQADQKQTLAFQKLQADDLALTDMNALAINSITLTDASAYLHIRKNGKFEFDEWLVPSNTAKTKPPAEKTTKTSKTSFQYSVGSFHYTSSRPISFIDSHLKEPFSFVLPKLDIKAGPIDSEKPEAPTQIKLDASTTNLATLKLDASVDPLAAKPDLNGKMIISGLDLRTLSPLTRQYIGYSVRSGQLDSNIKLKADKGVLDSNMTLTFNQFDLRSLDAKESRKFDSDMGFPLNTALSLLRDKDNRIKLDIPVTGDINKPDFDPADAIRTATSKAVTAAVLYYYTPYGLILAANTAFDLATALRFDPVVFDAGKDTLKAEQIKQIDTVANMMKKRPGIHLTLCGISSITDTESLYPKVVKAAKKSKDGKITLSDAQKKALLQLADQRSRAVKDYLVDKKKIDASRLILCEPEYQGDSKKSVVDISI